MKKFIKLILLILCFSIGINIIIVGQMVHSGNNAAKIEYVTIGTPGADYGFDRVDTKIAVTGSHQLQVKAWVKAGRPSINDEWWIRAAAYQDTTWLGDTELGQYTQATETWTEYSFNYTLPASANFININVKVRLPDGAMIVVDDVSIIDVTAGNTPLTLSNAGFEDWPGNRTDVPTDWRPFATNNGIYEVSRVEASDSPPLTSGVALLLTFDTTIGTNLATYTPGPGDVPLGVEVSREFNKPFVGSERDYGTMPPGDIDTGNYPDIVTPSTEGIQGGNAFWTCAGNVGDSQQHIGWYINKNNKISVSGSFTAEAVFMLAKIGTVADPILDCEYSLQNIFGTDMLSGAATGTWAAFHVAGSGAAWELRVWPIGIIGGDGKLQLWTGNTITSLGELDIDSLTAPMNINQWYHVVCVYDAPSNTISLYLDNVLQGSTNPAWANTGQNDWWIGAWPSNGANRGMAGWLDAVAISYGTLIPDDFVLSHYYLAESKVWELY